MIILAIDPGTEQSACLWYHPDDGSLGVHNIRPNGEVLSSLRYPQDWSDSVVVCEMVQHYGSGLAVGKETFETVRWIGRFQEAVEARGGRFEILYRPAIKAHLCGSAKAKDGNVRQALIDRFGGDSIALKGKKCPKCKGAGVHLARLPHHSGSKDSYPTACEPCKGSGWLRKPGPLTGITSHMWAALAVAITWAETQKERP